MKKVLIIIILLFSFNVKAYTKEDIINLSYEIKTCSTETSNLINGARTSYIRLLKQKDISESDLNKIYNNINDVITYLNNNDICDVNMKDELKTEIKDKLMSLYEETNNIIINAPKIDGNKSDTKVIIDSNNNEIKIYEDGNLEDKVELTTQKLNYVGLNKMLIILIIISSSLLLISILLTVLKKLRLIPLIYINIILLPILIIFRSDISLVLDTISLMSVNTSYGTRGIVINDQEIISYPLIGEKYGTLYLKDDKEDIYFGDEINILKQGLGQSTSSNLPGENKKTILSGHNTGILSNLANLRINENVVIETVYGKFTYIVNRKNIVKDTEIEALDIDSDLILYTCYPNGNLYTEKRIIVYLKLEKSEWLGDNYE